jgi:hypothetical protein
MARPANALLNNLSTADLKRLLAARERIDVLEQERAVLQDGLARVDRELGKLMAGAAPAAQKAARTKIAGKKAGRKKTGKKKAAKKKDGRKKTAKKKVTKKKVTKKKAGTKKTATKKAARKKVAAKKTGKSVAARGGSLIRPRLEDVIVGVIGSRGGKVPYKELYAAIVNGRLFASRSGNFDNVLRRTLSTSAKVKTVSRGVYGLA